MKSAILFGSAIDSSGRTSLNGLVAHVAVPIPRPPDVVVYRGKLYVLHYDGIEVYYREASVYHYQNNSVTIDGEEILVKPS